MVESNLGYLCNDVYFELIGNKERTFPDFDFIANAFELDKKTLLPLQDEGSRNNPSFRTKVVYARTSLEQEVKIRWCRDETEALKMFHKVCFAFNKGIPTSRPINYIGQAILLNYVRENFLLKLH